MTIQLNEHDHVHVFWHVEVTMPGGTEGNVTSALIRRDGKLRVEVNVRQYRDAKVFDSSDRRTGYVIDIDESVSLGRAIAMHTEAMEDIAAGAGDQPVDVLTVEGDARKLIDIVNAQPWGFVGKPEPL